MTSRFMWYSLITTDAQAAEAFYCKVVGWTATQMQPPPESYSVFNVAGGGVGGVMPLPPPAQGQPPAWIGYVSVDDVDDYAKRVTKAGGTVHHEPTDIPNGVGRFAVVSDPQGAVFNLFKPGGQGELPSGGPDMPGLIGWRELMAADLEPAFKFYADMFGWKKLDVFDMGPMGPYQIFSFDGSEANGGMMKKMDAAPRPFWSFYIQVDAIDAAIGRLTEAGGKLVNGPMQVPGGQWTAQAMDPQGAFFCLVSTKK